MIRSESGLTNAVSARLRYPAIASSSTYKRISMISAPHFHIFPLKSLCFLLFIHQRGLNLTFIGVIICQCCINLSQRQMRIMIGKFFRAVSLFIADSNLLNCDARSVNSYASAACFRRRNQYFVNSVFHKYTFYFC